MSLTCFKAYDIRGRLGTELDEGIAARIGRGFARALAAETVVLGRDVRPTSEALADAVAQALIDEGVEVLDLGLCGTEEVYAATGATGATGGICITASHNPMDYNGMKLVGAGAAPLDPQGALAEIKRLAEADAFGPAKPGGTRRDIAATARAAYVDRVLGFMDISAIRPLRIVVNAGHGAAGPTFDAWPRHLQHAMPGFNSSASTTPPTPAFPRVSPTPFCLKTGPPRPRRCARTGPISGSPGMAISTAVSSSITKAASWMANTWWACLPPPSSPDRREKPSSMTPAWYGTRRMSWPGRAGMPCRRAQGMPS